MQLEERGVMLEKVLRREEGLTLTTSPLHPPGKLLPPQTCVVNSYTDALVTLWHQSTSSSWG